jgi:succinate dehydrogenase/fumarate reductase-like Fe-S protein
VLANTAGDEVAIEPLTVNLTVNDQARRVTVEPRMTLLDALREKLTLTGTKKACDRGECGACTVHVEGKRILSCMTLAAMVEGKRRQAYHDNRRIGAKRQAASGSQMASSQPVRYWSGD